MRVYNKSITLSAEELNALSGAIASACNNKMSQGCAPFVFKTLDKLKKRLDSKTLSQEAIQNILNQNN